MSQSDLFHTAGVADFASGSFQGHDSSDLADAVLLVEIRDLSHQTPRQFLETLLIGAVDDAQAVADQLLARYFDVASIFSADPGELIAIAGGPAALRLKITHEAAQRIHRDPLHKRDLITSWAHVRNYLIATLSRSAREEVRILYLDKRNQLILDEQASRGTIDFAPVFPREIMRRALELNAAAILVVHNHPSGSTDPSRGDIEMTKQIVAAGKTLNIAVHDHCIVAGNTVVSMHALGLM